MKNIFTALTLMLVAQHGFAEVPLPVAALGEVQLPLELGGIASIAAVSLILGTQLIKRRK